MGNGVPGTGIRKRLVIFLVLLLSSINIFSLDMEVSPDSLLEGRIITLRIQTDILDTESIDVEDLELPDNLQLISGPVVRPYYKRVDGRSQRFHQITWALRSYVTGIYNIDPINIITEDGEIPLNIPELRIFSSDERFNNYPLIISWNKDIKRDIYVGESIPLIVEAYNLEEINFPDNIIANKPRRGDIVSVSGLGEIKPERVGESDLYRVPVASWVYTAFEAGSVTIPAVRVDINGLTRYTEPLTLNVIPLPNVNETGGVGQFMITTELDETQVTPDDTFKYRVRISGQGNIPYLTFPELDYSGLVLIDKNESESIEASNMGYLGWRQVEYTFQAIDSGVKEISLDQVSWIDQFGNETFYNGNVSHINVVSVKVIEEDVLPFLTFMTTPEIITSYKRFLYKNPYFWSLLGLSSVLIIIFSIAKLFKKRKSQKILLMSAVLGSLLFMSALSAKGFEYQGQLVMADTYIDNGEYKDALLIYDELDDNLSYNYGIYVNKAILWDKLGDTSNAVYNIRIAERISPDNSKIKNIKDYLSDSEESRQKQAKTANNFNPDYFFITLLLFFNLMVFALYKLYKVKSMGTYSLLFGAILFTTVSSILLVLVHTKNSVDAGVIVTGGAELTKVPNEKALNWMNLEEGNCVYIKSEWEDRYLIETEYGLQGWVDKDSLLVLEER